MRAAILLLTALPMIALAAPTEGDDVVILSVAPRDPSVKPEILLTPRTAPVAAKAPKIEADSGGSPVAETRRSKGQKA